MRKALVIILAVGLAALAAHAALNSGPWPIIGHDARHTGRSAHNVSATAPALKWTYSTGQRIRSNPVVNAADEVIFGADDGYVYCLRSDGTLRWRYHTGEDPVRGTAVIDDGGYIYIGADSGYVYRLTSAGALSWRYDTALAPKGPCGLGDYLYVGSYRYLYALTTAGSRSWWYAAGDTIRSAPAVDSGGNVYFGADDTVIYCVASDSTLRWSYDTDGIIRGGAAVDSAGVAYVGSADHQV